MTTARHHVRAVAATGYVGDGSRALFDDGSWKVPAAGAGGGSAAGGEVLLAEAVLTADTATITFATADIPDVDYADLRIAIHGRGTAALTDVNVDVTINGDSSDANYRNQNLRAVSSAVSGTHTDAATGVRSVGILSAATQTANYAGHIDARVLNFLGTTFYKQIVGLSHDATTLLEERALTWKSTNAVTSLSFACRSGSFKAGTVARLYGMSTAPASTGGGGVGVVDGGAPDSTYFDFIDGGTP